MAVNKDAIGILFGVAGGGEVNSESYKEINDGLNKIVKNINANDPKYITLRLSDKALVDDLAKIKEALKDIHLETKINVEADKTSKDIKKIGDATSETNDKLEEQRKLFDRVAAAQKRWRESSEGKAKLQADTEIAAATKATSALIEYRDALKQVAETKNIAFGKDQFFSMDGKKDSFVSAEKLTELFRRAKDALSDSNLPSEGKQYDLIKSYQDDIAKIASSMRTLEGAELKEALAAQEVAKRRHAANDALLETLKALRALSSVKGEWDEISFDGGTFALTQAGGDSSIRSGSALDSHRENLLEAIEKANNAYGNFQTAIKQGGVDLSKLAGSKQIAEMGSLVNNIAEQMSQAAKDAQEMHQILYQTGFDRGVTIGKTDFRFDTRRSGIVGAFADQIKQNKDNPEALKQLMSGVQEQAVNIAKEAGDDAADEFFHELQKRTQMRLPYWKKSVDDTLTSAKEGENANATQEENKELQKSVELEKQKTAEKSRSKKETKETAGATKEENKELEKSVELEEKKKTKKSQSKKETKETTENLKEENKELEKSVDLEDKKNSKKSQSKKDDKDIKRQNQEAVQTLKEYYKVLLEVANAQTRTHNIEGNAKDGFTFSQSDDEYYNNLHKKLDMAQEKYQKLSKTQRDYLKKSGEAARANIEYEVAHQAKMKSSEILYAKRRDNAQKYYQDVIDIASRDEEALKKLIELKEIADRNDPREYDLLNEKLEETKGYIDRLGLSTETWFQKMQKTFGTRLRSLLAGVILGKVTLYLRQVYTNVVEIDSAMTQLKIVTGASDYQMTKFLTNATKLAKELGTSIKDVLASVETFSRLGYNIEESTVLAQYANILSRVAGVSSDQATTGLTSIIKGYGFDPTDAQHVSDVLIEVGQKYAVSASELMEAYQKAGAALNATNTTFEKSAGLIAAANASVQDASVVGTALKTVAARIRTSTTDLEELGESTEDLAEGFSKYADEIRALTGFNIMEGDSKTQYKDLYDIMLGISEVWDTLSDTAQSRVAAILGGTRQFTVIASILSNMKDATGAYDDALNSAGTSTQALAIYTDSIQGRVDKLQAGFEEFSVKLLNSDLIKAGTDFLGVILKVADGLVWIIDNGPGLTTLIISLTGLIAAMNADKIISNFGKFTDFFKSLPSKINDVILTFQKARAQNDGFFTALSKSAHEAGIEISAAGAAISLVTLGITAVTTAWNVITKIQQERTRAAIENAENAKREYEEETKVSETLATLIQRYKELANEKGGYWKPDAAKEVRSIQDQIVDLVGDQAAQLDLVNGKLKEEEALLGGIAQSQGELTRQQAEKALKEADIAIRNKMGEWVPGLFGAYNIGGFDSEDYGDITTTGKRGFAWQDFLAVLSPFAALVNNAGTKSIQKDFDNAEEFVRQYEAVVDWVNNKAKTLDVDDSAAVEYYQNAQRYLNDFRDVYEAYQSAKSVIDGFNKETAPEAQSSVTRNIIIPLRSVEVILGETEEAYDALTAAMEDMEKQGYLSAASLKKLLELEKSGGFGGVSILDFLEQTAEGYKLNADAMENWVDALITHYTTAQDMSELSITDINNAVANLKNLQTVLATLALTANKEKSAAEKRKDALNDEKDALKEQLDAYKKLIDIRKELLKQYQDELNYRRELEKRQQKVATLEAQAAASRLDNSAAGRARTRKLEEDLKSARQDLEDFTLEHAIEVLTKELDNQYEEYKALIDGDLKRIEDQIAGLSESNKDLSAALRNAADKIQALIEEYESHKPEPTGFRAPKDPRDRMLYEDRGAGGYDDPYETVAPTLIWDPNLQSFVPLSRGVSTASSTKYGRNRNILMKYHSGGVVGNDARLKSTEEFAKLLKGEFVSTPAQMKRFMEFTLPSLLQSGDTTAGNEFNSPLIEINCETVSTEAIPKVKAVVEDAVNEIKKMFDDGFSRTGFKKTTKKFLI